MPESILFYLRQAPQHSGTFQSVCVSCSEMVAEASSIGTLIRAESLHRCTGIETARMKQQVSLGVHRFIRES